MRRKKAERLAKLNKPKLIWRNLLDDRCPNLGCQALLEKRGDKQVCIMQNNDSCDFEITNERFRELRWNMRDRDVERLRDNQEELNNL